MTYGRLEVLVHVRRGEELLVLRRAEGRGGYWHPVAGGVEAGEDWPEAAARELREETGLATSRLREIGGYEYVREDWEPQPGMRVDVRAFVADAPPGWEPRLDREHDEYRWCSRDDALALLRWPEPRELLGRLAR